MNLRTVVALPRKRVTTSSGSKLDLAYVTPRLVVGSMPTSNYWRSWYRMGATELRDFLDTEHGSNWRIWNLQQRGEEDYEDDVFYGRVEHHPTEDHTPPSLAQLFEIVREIKAYLDLDDANVAVVHCKAGQGRSGTVACAYLQLHHGLSSDQALNTFTSARMRSYFGAGVRIPSQVRYLGYIGEAAASAQVSAQASAQARSGTSFGVQIKQIVLKEPYFDDVLVNVVSAVKCSAVASTAAHQWDHVTRKNGNSTVLLVSPVKTLHSPLDVAISFHRSKSIKGVALPQSIAKLYFNAGLEASRAIDGKQFSCKWADLDGAKGFSIKGFALFESVEVHFALDGAPAEVPAEAPAEDPFATPSVREPLTPSTMASEQAFAPLSGLSTRSSQ